MFQRRVFIIVFLLLNSFGAVIYSQVKTPSNKKLESMARQAIQFFNDGNFEKSISVSRQVLHFSSISKNYSLHAMSYKTFAANLDELSETDKAIFYYNKGLQYANKANNDSIKNFINNNLGNIYCFEKKQYKKGIQYYKNSLGYSEKAKDTAQILFTKLNITWAYFDIGLYSDGAKYLEFLNKYHSKFDEGILDCSLNMLNGMYASYKGDVQKADSFFSAAINNKGLEIDKSDLSNAHLEYSKFLFKSKNYEKAFENLALYNKIKEDLYNTEKLKKASVAGINLELDDFKREVNKIEIENKLQSESLKKSLIIQILLVVGFVILLVLLFTLYRNFKYKIRINKELLNTNEELLIAKEKAEAATIAKSHFISTMSHELRTPLYGVIGITNMLLEEHKELKNSPHLFSLKFSAKYLLSIVNDVLQINKIVEKKVVLESSVFNIFDEVQLIVNSLSFLAKNHDNKLELNIDPSISDILIGDKLRLSQILINLISNALKFTKEGVVEVFINLIKIENENHYIEFVIKDNGVGIGEKDLNTIFEKFVQVGRNENDYQGTGLGLSIVKHLLELFESEICVESEIGKGSTFKFTIAFEHSPAKHQDYINNINVDLSTTDSYTVLIVEDNKINQIITKKVIEKNYGICTLVDDGFQALDILEKKVFDIILMDINMPMMNGFETTRKIRLKGIQTPVVALTAFAKDEIAEEAILVGMNDIMIKPFEAVKLYKVIKSQIYNSKKTVLEVG